MSELRETGLRRVTLIDCDEVRLVKCRGVVIEDSRKVVVGWSRDVVVAHSNDVVVHSAMRLDVQHSVLCGWGYNAFRPEPSTV